MPGGGKQQAEDWDSAAKFAVVLETASLSEEALATYCRSKGLYVEQVRLWRLACEQANARREVDAANQAQRSQADRKRIKELERELHRKERSGPHPLDSDWTMISAFLHHEQQAQERSNETKETYPFT